MSPPRSDHCCSGRSARLLSHLSSALFSLPLFISTAASTLTSVPKNHPSPLLAGHPAERKGASLHPPNLSCVFPRHPEIAHYPALSGLPPPDPQTAQEASTHAPCGVWSPKSQLHHCSTPDLALIQALLIQLPSQPLLQVVPWASQTSSHHMRFLTLHPVPLGSSCPLPSPVNSSTMHQLPQPKTQAGILTSSPDQKSDAPAVLYTPPPHSCISTALGFYSQHRLASRLLQKPPHTPSDPQLPGSSHQTAAGMSF